MDTKDPKTVNTRPARRGVELSLRKVDMRRPAVAIADLQNCSCTLGSKGSYDGQYETSVPEPDVPNIARCNKCITVHNMNTQTGNREKVKNSKFYCR